jgi:hypothetical protein
MFAAIALAAAVVICFVVYSLALGGGASKLAEGSPANVVTAERG